MAESVIVAKRRQEALDRAAKILGVRPPVPSTKAETVVREAYMAELILALAERAAGKKPEADKAEIDSGPPFRIPE